MTAYVNLSFETADPAPRINVAGESLLADNWTSSGVSARSEYIDFGEGEDVAEPAERFETAWTGLATFSDEFESGDLEAFLVNTGSDISESETFSFWVVPFAFELIRVELLKFNGDTLSAESFEADWGNTNAIFEFTPADLEAAVFGSFGDEDFEEGWGNDVYLEEFVGVGTDLEFAVFTGSDDFEDFEDVKNAISKITIADAQSGETYEVNINQRVLDIVSSTTDETVLRDLIVAMINNSPEPVTATPDGSASFFLADDVLPTTSIIGVDGPASGSGPSITITDVRDLGFWSQNGLIEGFVDL